MLEGNGIIKMAAQAQQMHEVLEGKNIVSCIACGKKKHWANMTLIYNLSEESEYICPECQYGL